MIDISTIHRTEAEQSLRDLFPGGSQPTRPQDAGTWFGTGATLLHLQDPVRPTTLRNLMNGRTPAGLRLVVPDHDAPERIVAWRFTFSAPEDVSARWATAPTPERARLFAAHTVAVADALERFDGRITGFKDGPPWEEYPTSTFAVFGGAPSQSARPQLQHTAIFVNLGFHPDRTVQTYTTQAVLDHAQEMNAIHQSGLGSYLKSQAPPSHRLLAAFNGEQPLRQHQSLEPPATVQHQPSHSRGHGHSH